MERKLKDKQERKTELLDELFELGGNQDEVGLKLLKDDLEDFFRNYKCYDNQISNAMTLIRIQLEVATDHSVYKKFVELAEQACYRLLYGGLEDYYDIRLAVVFAIYTRSFENSKELADLVVEKLEDYSSHSRYNKIKKALSGNVIKRLVLQMYSEDAIFLNEDASLYDPVLVFNHHFDIAVDLCEKMNDHVWKAVHLIRKGCFFKIAELVLENLEWLRENDLRMYEQMFEEFAVCGLDINNLQWEEE